MIILCSTLLKLKNPSCHVVFWNQFRLVILEESLLLVEELCGHTQISRDALNIATLTMINTEKDSYINDMDELPIAVH